MSKFNVTQRQIINTPTTTNLAGGVAFELTKREQLVGAICTSFAADSYYESWQNRAKRLLELIAVDPVLAAKTAVFARRIENMRSISHFTMGHAVQSSAIRAVNGLTRLAINRVVIRPDDVTEIASIIGKKMPNGVKNGLSDALEGFNEYQMAKYARFGRDYAWNLNDVVRLVHAGRKGKGTVIEKLVYRTLKNEDTWEAMLSEAGSDLGKKKAAWLNLLTPNDKGRIKLGYMALLRNVRNIHQLGSPEASALLCKALVNEVAIDKSRVLPFRFLSAIKVIEQDNQARHILGAITKAMDIAFRNVPVFGGNTAVLLDGSGSMNDPLTTTKVGSKFRTSDATRLSVACLFGAMLCKGPCIPIMYSNDAKPCRLGGSTDLYAMYHNLISQAPHGGTNLGVALDLCKRSVQALQVTQPNYKLDRIIIITDEESWMDPPRIDWFKGQLWTFNLAGYGTSEFHESRRRTVYGFSEKIFEIIPQIETGGLAKFIEDWWDKGCPDFTTEHDDGDSSL